MSVIFRVRPIGNDFRRVYTPKKALDEVRPTIILAKDFKFQLDVLIAYCVRQREIISIMTYVA